MLTTNQSQTQIIKGCIDGKRSSQEQLYKLLYGKMYAVCMRYAENRAEAEDFLHDGFIKLFSVIKKYSFRVHLRAGQEKYLHTLV